MVRLKGIQHPIKFRITLFQFHYGTIKRPLQLSTEYFLIQDFNSTMVRLKGCRNEGAFAIVQFQFHYGTIKSKVSSGRRIYVAISIPLWYD